MYKTTAARISLQLLMVCTVIRGRWLSVRPCLAPAFGGRSGTGARELYHRLVDVTPWRPVRMPEIEISRAAAKLVEMGPRFPLCWPLFANRRYGPHHRPRDRARECRRHGIGLAFGPTIEPAWSKPYRAMWKSASLSGRIHGAAACGCKVWIWKRSALREKRDDFSSSWSGSRPVDAVVLASAEGMWKHPLCARGVRVL